MKNLSVLSLLVLLVACNGAGGGGEASVDSSDISASEKLSLFEENFKDEAEALEDSAVLRFNPCRDELNWTSTGATTGTVELSGITFNATNVVDITKNGECDYTVTTGDTNGLTSYSFTPTVSIPMSGDYTTIQIVNGGSLSLRTDASSNSPSLLITETGAHASFGISDANGLLSKSLYRRLMKANIQNSYSYALFEVDSVGANVNFEHYNNHAPGVLPLSVIGNDNFDQDAIPEIASTELAVITMSRYQDNGSTFHYDTKGGVAFILFDRHLTDQEKSLMGCYALYLSTKTGNLALWNAHHSTVCKL